MHKCSKCGKSYERTPEFFGVDKARNDGLSSHCRQCIREKNRLLYANSIGKSISGLRKSQDWRHTGIKKCTKCGESKNALECFHKSARSGLASWCKECERIKAKAKRKTPEKFESETHKQCVKCWEIKPRDGGFYKSSKAKDGLSVYCVICYREMLAASRGKHQEKWRKARAKVINETPELKMHYRILGLVRKAIERKDLAERPLSVTGEFWQAVGYTRAELVQHLERQFLPGMGWHNMSDWHIDHILPVKDFNFSSFGDADFVACWSLANLRPLWAVDNLKKRDKREFLI